MFGALQHVTTFRQPMKMNQYGRFVFASLAVGASAFLLPHRSVQGPALCSRRVSGTRAFSMAVSQDELKKQVGTLAHDLVRVYVWVCDTCSLGRVETHRWFVKGPSGSLPRSKWDKTV